MGGIRSGRGSINRRLKWWMTGTTGVALSAACAFFVAYDALEGRQTTIENAAMLAQVIGIDSAAALTFQDARAAEETLAGLAAAHGVRAAVIYDAQGQPFASYVAKPIESAAFAAPPVEGEGHRFESGQLHLFSKISFQGEPIGSIYLRLDTSALTARMWWFLTVALLLNLATAGFSTLVSSRLRRQIGRPLAALVESSQAISDGDLSIRVPVSTQDELGTVAATFNAMTAGLRALVDQVRQSIREVADVSRGLQERGGKLFRDAKRQAGATSDVGESIDRMISSICDVNSSVEQLSETSHETASSIIRMDVSIGEIAFNMDELTTAIDTTSTAVDQLTANIDQVVGNVETLHAAADLSGGRVQELSRSVRQIKVNAAQSHALSEESSQVASRGMAAVTETIDAMGEISSGFGQLQQRVSHLAEKSKSIDEIIQVISDVAEQTGLLSLNAAIIAAQAGKHGKAFSVVAEQVSSLADRTHRSAREVSGLIRAVQGDTAAAVSAVVEGSAKVERGVQRSHIAGEVLGQIIEKTSASTNRALEIVEAATVQSNDLERVDNAVSEVQQIVREINQAMHDQHAATKNIAQAVNNIRSLGTSVRCSTEEQRRGSSLIIKTASRVTDMVNQIAEATNAQQRSSETIRHALQVFTDVADETTRGAEEINENVATLSERAEHLEKEIDHFRTG
jgi:methyl-accepting chemotaxis protein